MQYSEHHMEVYTQRSAGKHLKQATPPVGSAQLMGKQGWAEQEEIIRKMSSVFGT